MTVLKPFSRLWQLIVLDRKEITSIYFYAVLSGLLQLSLPVGIQAIVGFVLGASMVTSIYVLIVLVVLGVVAVGIMQMNQMKIIEKIQQKIFTRNAFEFAEKIPRFDLIKTDAYYLPEKVNRFFDTLNVQKGLSKLLLDVPLATIQILFGLLLLSFYHPFFIVFGLLLVLILWLIFWLTGKRGLSTSLDESVHKYAVVGWLEEMARVIHPFKLSQQTNLSLQKTDTNVVRYLEARTSHFRILLFQYRALVFFKIAITTAMLTVGSYLLVNQSLNIGAFIAAEIVILMVINAVEKLIVSLDSVYDVVTGLEKIATVTENLTEADGHLKLNHQEGGISLELIGFSFGYPTNKSVVKDINLSIPAQSVVCISKLHGSGSSTLLKVLGGFYTEFKGSFLLNGIPLSNFDFASLRSRTGVYLSDQDVFIGTVWENIVMGREGITPRQVITIATEMGIPDFLKTLPHGFETKIAPNGKNIPGITLKSILLLRAMLNNPKLILLEDPWEDFPVEVKRQMIDYLAGKRRSATVIVATEDSEFVQSCDFQILMENGSVLINKHDNNGSGAK